MTNMDNMSRLVSDLYKTCDPVLLHSFEPSTSTNIYITYICMESCMWLQPSTSKFYSITQPLIYRLRRLLCFKPYWGGPHFQTPQIQVSLSKHWVPQKTWIAVTQYTRTQRFCCYLIGARKHRHRDQRSRPNESVCCLAAWGGLTQLGTDKTVDSCS